MTKNLDKNTEKMVNLGRMTRGVLHDLNNSLASIMGFASFLSDDLDPSSEHHIFAENIKRAGTQIENLVKQIHALAMEQGSSKDVMLNLVNSIKETTESAKSSMNNNQHILFTTDVKEAFLNLVPFQFQVAISNLIKNAIQSLEEKSGTVMVRVTSVDNFNNDDLKGDYHLISHLYYPNTLSKKPLLRIDIVDTGCGMNDVTLNLAPSPHFTTKSADIANGLGLTVSSHIIHYLDGGMSIATSPNIGTRVTIVLPVEKITP